MTSSLQIKCQLNDPDIDDPVVVEMKAHEDMALMTVDGQVIELPFDRLVEFARMISVMQMVNKGEI